MSKEALAKVVQRSISDAAFRRQLATDPSGALRGYDLSAEESSALRSGDSARLSSFGVDQRMSKAFSISDPSSMGGATVSSAHSDLSAGSAGSTMNASVTGTDGAQATGSDTLSGGTGGSPIIPSDPARADSVVTGGEPRDTAPAWIGDYRGDSTGALQNPDAADRNAAFTDAASSGAVQSPDAADRNLAAAFTGSAEPRDVEPTWIGDNQSLSSVMPESGTQVAGSAAFDEGVQYEGFAPSIGHAADVAVDTDEGGATSGSDATDGPNIQP